MHILMIIGIVLAALLVVVIAVAGWLYYFWLPKVANHLIKAVGSGIKMGLFRRLNGWDVPMPQWLLK